MSNYPKPSAHAIIRQRYPAAEPNWAYHCDEVAKNKKSQIIDSNRKALLLLLSGLALIFVGPSFLTRLFLVRPTDGYFLKTWDRNIPTVAAPAYARRQFFTNSSFVALHRAFQVRGWRRTNRTENAELIWTSGPAKMPFSDMEKWQRPNHVRLEQRFENKANMLEGFRDYESRPGNVLNLLHPESYRLNNAKERELFLQVLDNGGMNEPWVLKEASKNDAKGIRMLGPNSADLKGVRDRLREGSPQYAPHVIQKYLCNELTYVGHKIDVRAFWLVASIVPLVVLYHDGVVRVGGAKYNETDFESTRAHITGRKGAEGATNIGFTELQMVVENHARNAPHLANLHEPFQHVRNQMKAAVAELVEVFRDVFHEDDIPSENAFSLFGADFIIDNDLD